jgi:phosphatidylglycerophosphatase A
VAPGTAGTVASLVIWGPLLFTPVPWWGRLALVLGTFFLGIWASNRAARFIGNDDPKEVVIDEVAGMGLTLVFAPPSFITLALGFVLFRIFDIWKPWPVRWADRKLHGGMGIMLDDVIAGLYALGLLTLWQHFGAPLLGA